MASGILRRHLQLNRGDTQHSVPFYFLDDTLTMEHQLKYYRLQGYTSGGNMKEGDLLGPFQCGEDGSTERIGVEGLEKDLLWTVRGSVSTEQLAETWVTEIGTGMVASEDVDAERVVQEFVDWFSYNGLYDVKTNSESRLTTLHVFYILMDLHQGLVRHCQTIITGLAEKIPFEFQEVEEAEETLRMWKDVLLLFLLEADPSSNIFIDCISFLSNRRILEVIPELNLFIGDIEEPDLLGFDQIESIEKQLTHYIRGLDSERVSDKCVFRILGLLCIVDQTTLRQILPIVPARIFDDIHSNAGRLDAGSLLTLIDTNILIPDLSSGRAPYSDLSIVSTLKHQLRLSLDGEKKSWLKEIKNRVRGDTTEQIDKILIYCQNNKFEEAVTLLTQVLEVSIPLDGFVGLLLVAMEVIRSMAFESIAVEQDINERHILEALDMIMNLLLDFHFEKQVSRVCIFALALLYIEKERYDEGIELLKMLFLIKATTLEDLRYNKEALGLLCHSMEVKQDTAIKEVDHFIEQFVGSNEVYGSIKNRIYQRVNEILEKSFIYNFRETDVQFFSNFLDAELVRPCLSNILKEVLSVYKKQNAPSQSNTPLKSNILILKQVLKDPESFLNGTGHAHLDRLNSRSPSKLGSQFTTAPNSKEAHDSENGQPMFFNYPEKRNQVYTLMAQITSEIEKDESSRIRIFRKDQFEIDSVESNLETFSHNDCNIFRATITANKQRCCIFEVSYADMTVARFRSLSVYLKMFHPNILCFYGITLEPDYETDCLRIGYVAEYFDSTLSMLGHKQISDLPQTTKVLSIFSILFALNSFHLVGLCFYQLNPDTVTLTGNVTKLIFPFFLPTRMHFVAQYLKSIRDDHIMNRNILFIKPEAIENSHHLTNLKVGIFEDQKFAESFEPAMRCDLYSFIILSAYLLNPGFFDRVEYKTQNNLQTYLNLALQRKNWFQDIVTPMEIFGPKVKEDLSPIFLAKPSKSTFELFSTFLHDSKFQFPELTLPFIWPDFRASINHTTQESKKYGSYFPCGVIVVPQGKNTEEKIYINGKLLCEGEFFHPEEPSQYSFRYYPSNKETLWVQMNGMSIFKVTSYIKTDSQGSSSSRHDLICHLDKFHPKTSIPLSLQVEDLLSKLTAVRDRPKIKHFLETMTDLAGKLDNMPKKGGNLDPFGNFLWVKRGKKGFPVFTSSFAIEGYSMHNYGKIFVSKHNEHPGKFFLGRFNTYSLAEYSRPITKYSDLFVEFDSASQEKAFVVTPQGSVFRGSLTSGWPSSGKIIDSQGNKFNSAELENNQPAPVPDQEELPHKIQVLESVSEVMPRTNKIKLQRIGFGEMKKDGVQVYQGHLSEGIPHGKGSLYWQGRVLFMGLFRNGRPAFGIFNPRNKVISGRVLVSHRRRQRGSNPSDRYWDQTKPPLDFIFAPDSQDFQVCLYGFSIHEADHLVFCELQQDMSIQNFSQKTLNITPNTSFQGQLKDGKPSGRGVAFIDKLGFLTGTWDPNTQQVTGMFLGEDPLFNKKPVVGVFSYKIDNDKFEFGGWARCEFENGSGMEGFFTQDGFEGYCSWRGRDLKRVGKIVDGFSFDGAVIVEVVNSQRLGFSGTWVENWEQGEVKWIYSEHKPILLQGLATDWSNHIIYAKVKLLEGWTYELIGPLTADNDQVIVQGLLVDEDTIMGELRLKDNGLVFKGQIIDMEPQLGSVITENVQTGYFENFQLVGEGLLEYPSKQLVINCQFERGSKEGIVLVEHKGVPVFIGEYQNNARQGYGLKLYSNCYQLAIYHKGEPSTVFVTSLAN